MPFFQVAAARSVAVEVVKAEWKKWPWLDCQSWANLKKERSNERERREKSWRSWRSWRAELRRRPFNRIFAKRGVNENSSILHSIKMKMVFPPCLKASTLRWPSLRRIKEMNEGIRAHSSAVKAVELCFCIKYTPVVFTLLFMLTLCKKGR